MVDDNTDCAGPRRYQVKVDVRADAVGPLFGLLIKEVEQPKMDQTDPETYRIVFVCFKDQMPTIVGLINDPAVQYFIGPHVPEVKMAPAVFKPPRSNYTPPSTSAVEVKKIPPKATRNRGGKYKDTGLGKTILGVFKDQTTANPSDFTEAAVAAGYAANSAAAVTSNLVAEGSLVRIGLGLYRLPRLDDARASQTETSE